MLDRPEAEKKTARPCPSSILFAFLRRHPSGVLVLGSRRFACEVFVDVLKVEVGRTSMALGFDSTMLVVLRAKLERLSAWLLTQQDGPAIVIRRAHLIMFNDLVHLEDRTTREDFIGANRICKASLGSRP